MHIRVSVQARWEAQFKFPAVICMNVLLRVFTFKAQLFCALKLKQTSNQVPAVRLLCSVSVLLLLCFSTTITKGQWVKLVICQNKINNCTLFLLEGNGEVFAVQALW